MRAIESFKRMMRDDSGATAIEYAIIVLLIAVASVYGFTLVGYSVRDIFEAVVTAFEEAQVV